MKQTALQAWLSRAVAEGTEIKVVVEGVVKGRRVSDVVHVVGHEQGHESQRRTAQLPRSDGAWRGESRRGFAVQDGDEIPEEHESGCTQHLRGDPARTQVLAE